ncbi:hypothetical protein H4Q26_009000 [Puccinia striiformis f. sp. tritici PST-130]|nr:hypothetical protein H4Q26_009000 [Puccinia striiformis f. sp. tritici PST-130]
MTGENGLLSLEVCDSIRILTNHSPNNAQQFYCPWCCDWLAAEERARQIERAAAGEDKGHKPVFSASKKSRASFTMYSAVCPIGDPARDLSRARGPAQKVVSHRRPTLASSQFSRPKGTVFSVDNLPQEIKNLQPSQRNGSFSMLTTFRKS